MERLIKSHDQLCNWLDEHAWFESGHIDNMTPSPEVDASDKSTPSTVTFDLGHMVGGSLWAGENRTIRRFRVKANSVHRWSCVHDHTYGLDHYMRQGVSTPEQETDSISLTIDENLSLVCDELEIRDLPDLSVAVVPSLNSREVVITAPAGGYPTPQEWVNWFAAVGLQVSWRRLGDIAVSPGEVPHEDYTGWFLQETEKVSQTQYGILFFACRPKEQGFYAILRVWNEAGISANDADRQFWLATARVVASIPNSIVKCGNCRLTGSEWNKCLENGISRPAIETLLHGG